MAGNKGVPPMAGRRRRRPAMPVMTMRPRVPGPVKNEYEDLYWKLNRAARTRGEVGQAAMAAFRHLQAHFPKDQEFALPPLHLLPTVARENVNEEIDQIQTMCDKLKRQLPQLLDEGEQIIRELGRMADVAAKEQKAEHHDLAQRLIRFLEEERDVLYPASVLVGEYVRTRIELDGVRKVQSRMAPL